jgi:hypothetical protein
VCGVGRGLGVAPGVVLGVGVGLGVGDTEGVGDTVGLGVGVGVGVEPPCAQYRPPVLVTPPPHTIISVPLQIAVCESRGEGAVRVLVGAQVFVLGSYRPPVLSGTKLKGSW